MPDQEFTANQQGNAFWDDWQAEIAAIGTTNPLINFEKNAYGQIDLAGSHPGGFSQFVAGKSTSLSNLVRDPLSFSRALSAARRIKAKADRIEQHFGVETLSLVGGLVNLQSDGFDLNLPILIWPVSLTSRSDDYEVSLVGAPRVNPSLVDAFSTCYQVQVNERELLSCLRESTDLVPIAVMNYLADLVSARAHLDLQRILVIGNFTTTPVQLGRDYLRQENPLLLELAGAKQPQLPSANLPTDFTLVADADTTQRRIVARALAGDSFAIEALPGCGYTQTTVNLLAVLAQAGKRVVVAAPRRQTLNELADRLADAGLPGLAIRSTHTWVDLVSAISRNEKAQGVDQSSDREGLAQAERDLESYHETLNALNPALGISIADALKQLATLSAMPNAPVTSARIEREKLIGNYDRGQALELLQRAHALGEFDFGPQDSAWFQAQFDSPAEVDAAVALAKRLRTEAFGKLSEQLNEFTTRVNFKPARSVEDWGLHLRLFVGVRETLDRFVNDVFDRPLTELIIATGPRRGGDSSTKMSGGNRRRLKKLAKEYLRPGMHVADMNSALRAIQEQRELWASYSLSQNVPQVPLGINDALVAYQAFIADLEMLQRNLDAETNPLPLAKLSLVELESKLNSLSNDTAALKNLGDRSLLKVKLNELGLISLVRDLAKLHVSREHLAAELDQAWWQSMLEALLAADSSLLNFNAETLEEIESRFCKHDAAVIASGSAVVAKQLSDRWHANVAKAAVDAGQFKALLKTGKANMPEVAKAAASIWSSAASAVLLSPYEAAEQLDGLDFDVAIIMDAAGSTIAENHSVLKRARQVIAFGDDAIAAPEGFEVEARPSSLGKRFNVKSIFDAAKQAYGFETLRISYRTSGQTLGGLVNREFYQNRIIFEPTPAELNGERSHIIEYIGEGGRATSTIEGATESLSAEVDRVVELVLHHALWQPQQSLFVASASSVHAERIRVELQKQLKGKPDLAGFFDAHGREKFEVVSIADLAHRIADRIIFSVGFGLTPRGGVSSDFGQLNGANGRRYLTNLLISARSQITVVSCMQSENIPSEGLSSGSMLLKTLLASAEDGGHVAGDRQGDPMLADLELRLKKLGARADTTFAERLPLVVSYAKTSAVVVPDWSLRGETWSEKLRLRPTLLRAMGWQYIRAQSFALFADPQAVALRIAEDLGMQVSRRTPPLFDQDKSFEDTDLAWGDRATSNDQRLQGDKPPHWG